MSYCTVVDRSAYTFNQFCDGWNGPQTLPPVFDVLFRSMRMIHLALQEYHDTYGTEGVFAKYLVHFFPPCPAFGETIFLPNSRQTLPRLSVLVLYHKEIRCPRDEVIEVTFVNGPF